MMGAAPRYMTAGFILEEGLPLSLLQHIVDSMGRAARDCGVALVAADTKVVQHGAADQLFITTACIGTVADALSLGAEEIRAGDKVLVSGSVGDHGATILAARDELGLSTDLQSDSQPLHDLVQQMLASGAALRFLRDPTRGGLPTVALLQRIRAHRKGADAAIIGDVVTDARHPLVLQIAWGSHRIVSMLTGEQIPRTC